MTNGRAGQRQDVLNGLESLAAKPVIDAAGRDERWPDVTNAVHWVVDDTFWDHADPSIDLGRILGSHGEVEAVRAVVAAVVAVSERLGAGATDAAWFEDPDWPRVRHLAGEAARLMRENDSA